MIFIKIQFDYYNFDKNPFIYICTFYPFYQFISLTCSRGICYPWSRSTKLQPTSNLDVPISASECCQTYSFYVLVVYTRIRFCAYSRVDKVVPMMIGSGACYYEAGPGVGCASEPDPRSGAAGYQPKRTDCQTIRMTFEFVCHSLYHQYSSDFNDLGVI